MALAAAFLAPSLAYAQAVNGPPQENPQPQVTPPTQVNVTPPALPAPGYLFDLTRTGSPLGSTLKDKGIYLNGSYIGDLLSVADGGRQQGTVYYNQVALGADFDMGRIAGITGNAIHVLAVSRFGAANNRKYIGSAYEGLAIAGPTITTRLAELSIDQSLINDRVRILAGRIPAGAEFATSELYCGFISGICGNLSPWAWSRNSNAGYWPLASWGARVTVKPTVETYIKAGVFEANPGTYTRSGWPWDRGWGTDTATGLMIPIEAGYRTTFANDAYPRAFSIGGFIDTSKYSDPYYNRTRRSIALNGGTAQQHYGRSSIYAQAQQMVWRPDSQSTRGLTLFGGVLFDTGGVEPVNGYYLVGASMKGPSASRPNDTLNFMTYTNIFNQRVVENYAAALARRGFVGNMSRSETVFELNYGLLFAPGFQLKPFAQLILHPDQVSQNPIQPHVTHAWAVGAQFSIALNDAFGLPAFARTR